MKCLLTIFLLVLCIKIHGCVDDSDPEVVEKRRIESQQVLVLCKKHIPFYQASEDGVREIASQLLESDLTKDWIKKRIEETNRRFFAFTYPSNGHLVNGYISFTPEQETAPLLVFLRGGNRLLGLMHPATVYSCPSNYTVLATVYSGGVSERVDEFGGAEVDDVENLVKFFSELGKKLRLNFQPEKKFLLGESRGGFEMFLALQCSTYLQNYFDKVASLSGLLDLRSTMNCREGMKQMFINDFGNVVGDKDWITYRNPVDHCDKIQKDLPILIIQGSEDHRTPIEEGRLMVSRLKENGCDVEYWEIEGWHSLPG